MYTNAALLALSVVVFCHQRKYGASLMSDLQSTEPPPDRIPATITRRFSKRYFFIREEKQKRTRGGEDDATSAERLSSGLICLFHGCGRMLDGEIATSKVIRANP